MSKSDKIKLLVYINFGILISATIYIIYISLQIVNTPVSLPEKYNLAVPKVLIYIVVTWTLVFIITLVINLILLQGVIQRNTTKCLIWLIISALGTIYHVNKIVWSFLQEEYLQGAFLLIWVLLNLYAMYLVKCFMKELKGDSALQPLTSSKDSLN